MVPLSILQPEQELEPEQELTDPAWNLTAWENEEITIQRPIKNFKFRIE